ncbi:efflux transporter outer membrane subunit [Sphingomonas sp. NFX23]|uniref:efflux transporter outer membrane subunit n=1 Tax=Sphingomonas sp. NFX23 TaxID=2819532 RepID=UPI003CEA19DC
MIDGAVSRGWPGISASVAVRRYAGLGLAAILVGCATAPSVRTPVTTLPSSYDASTSSLPAMSLDRWWNLYADAQLAGLVEHALANGLTAREAFSRLDEAQAVRSAALARYGVQGNVEAKGQIQRTHTLSNSLDIPGLGDSSSLTELFAPTTTKTGNASLPVSWELDLFGRRRAARQTADADLAAARFTYEGARATLAADVARSLFQARGLAAQLEDARATVTIQRRLVDVTGKRAARGLIATSEVDQVAGNLAQAEAQAADLAGALDATRRALLVLIGSGTSPLKSLPITATLSAVPDIPSSMPGELLTRRPDVREAQARLQAATGNVRLAELAFYPTITLQAALAFATQTGGIATTTISGSGGGSLAVPIFDRSRLKAELRGASARAEQAVLTYERTLQTAYSESDQALVRLEADRRRITMLDAGLARARRAYDAAVKRFDLGFTDLQAVLDAERTFRGARTALTTAHIDGLERSVQAFQALGGGWGTSTPQPSGY